MIGDIVKVTVDRPLGSYHPKHRDIYYPINYGYVKGVLAPGIIGTTLVMLPKLRKRKEETAA